MLKIINILVFNLLLFHKFFTLAIIGYEIPKLFNGSFVISPSGILMVRAVPGVISENWGCAKFELFVFNRRHKFLLTNSYILRSNFQNYRKTMLIELDTCHKMQKIQKESQFKSPNLMHESSFYLMNTNFYAHEGVFEVKIALYTDEACTSLLESHAQSFVIYYRKDSMSFAVRMTEKCADTTGVSFWDDDFIEKAFVCKHKSRGNTPFQRLETFINENIRSHFHS